MIFAKMAAQVLITQVCQLSLCAVFPKVGNSHSWLPVQTKKGEMPCQDTSKIIGGLNDAQGCLFLFIEMRKFSHLLLGT